MADEFENVATNENIGDIADAIREVTLVPDAMTIVEMPEKIRLAKLGNVTWQALKDLRDSKALVPGRQYRITDYECTTAQENTRSARHQFDIIVIADDVDKLNENARACLHEGDAYFANSKLEAWKIWYCLDNDTSRFAWADEENGKGVIYRMIDEWNNDCPYDFKNIQFTRKLTDGELDLVDGVDTWVYTFTWVNEDDEIEDLSLIGNSLLNDEGYISGIFDNRISEMSAYRKYTEEKSVLALGDNVFRNSYAYEGGTFYGCYGNKFGVNCFGNTFGNDVSNNSFGNYVNSNSFDNSVTGNTFGNDVSNNSFGNSVQSNAFGNGVQGNAFGNSVYSNTFGNNVLSNSFGNNVSNNSFGNSVQSNSFGNEVNRNSFGNGVQGNAFGNYFMYNTVKNNVQYVMTPDTVHPNWFKYVTLENGLAGASSANRLNLEGIQAVAGNDTPIKVARGVGTEIVAVWQNGKALAGLRKATPTTADWTDIPDTIDGGEY